MKYNFDVIIIGGGPAGSTLGSYLAKNNISCAIFEKEKFPRPHVGESLVASSTLIFQELGLIKKMEIAEFPKKYGAIWTTEKNKKVHAHDWEEVDDAYHMKIEFKERSIEGVEQNHTYHVDRAIFDELLINHAKELGCKVFFSNKVSKIDIRDNDAVVFAKNINNEEQNYSAKIIVDATGRNTLIGSKRNWKIKDPIFNQFAVHTWFKNYQRTKSENDNITIHFLPIANSWIWQIPITEEITSFGIVAQKENFVGIKDLVEAYFWDTLKTRPELLDKLNSAERIRDFTVEGDYSYAMTNIVDDRLLLIGDAARFVDPIFASGISIAMQSAKFASIDIIEALKKNQFDKSQFKNYKIKINQGCKNWHEFISLYYRLNVMFTYFISKPDFRFKVIKYLQGDVYDDSNSELITSMKKFVEGVEKNPKHPLHDYLGKLTANKFNPISN